MAALIMVSTFGANSGLILSGGRLFYAMAKMVCFQTSNRLNKIRFN
jgi:APA family basic amino acid/polyamine antiporter